MRFVDALGQLRSAQKGKRGVSLYSRWINRPFGRVLAAAAASIGIGPNAVTLISAVVTSAGLAVLIVFPPSAVVGLVVAVLLMLGFALDSADGQVARLTGKSSPAGEWLDHVVDAGKMVAVHAAVLVAFWKFDIVPAGYLLIPLIFLFVSVVFFSALTLFSLLSPKGDTREAAPSKMRAIALLPADYGVLAVSFALWGATAVFLPVYALLLIATTLIAAALMTKWFRLLSERAVASSR